jgi:hypothetical protein
MTMQDEDFGATPDVFAEVESNPDPGTGEDPLADPLADPPAGATEAELAGDNPSEAAPEPFAEEPELAPEAEPSLPGEEEALAAAEAAEPPPQAAEPQPADPLADPPAAEPEPEPEPPAAAEPEPEPPAVEPAKPTKKAGKKAAKKTSKKSAKKGGGEAKRRSERDYVVLYEVDGGAFAVGPTVTARTTAIALEKAFEALSEELGVNEFKNMVPVPATNWKPEPVAGETEQRTRVSIGN